MDIKQRELKIQEKRKTTLFRDFVKEICSWMPTNIYKHDFGLSRFPLSGRVENLMPPEQFVTKGVNTLQTQEIDVAK